MRIALSVAGMPGGAWARCAFPGRDGGAPGRCGAGGGAAARGRGLGHLLGMLLCPERAQRGLLLLLIFLCLLLLAGLAAGVALGAREPLPAWVGGGSDHDRSALSWRVTVFGSVAPILWGTTYPELQNNVDRSPLVLLAGCEPGAGSGQQTCGVIAALDQA